MVTLVFVGLIVAFFLFDLFVMRKLEPKAEEGQAQKATTEAAPPIDCEIAMPRGYFFHPGHVWARIRQNGDIAIGLDDFVGKTLGNPSAIEWPEQGRLVETGEAIVTIRKGDARLTFPAPVGGTIARLNHRVKESPALVTTHPYDDGWLLEITPAPASTGDLARLAIADRAAAWMRQEIEKLGDFLKGRPSGSGGQLLPSADTETVAAFEKMFLVGASGKEA